MPTTDLPPRFQLALRRAIFFGACLSIWLGLGTVAFSAIRPPPRSKADSRSVVVIDAKREELLNVLWSETIAKSEIDWAELANQKMEIYEAALLAHHRSLNTPYDRSFGASLERSFSLITTVGDSQLGPVDVDDYSTTGKIFAMFYAVIGIPLCLLLVSQLVRMVTSVWQGPIVFLPTIILVFLAAVLYDIVEGGEDDVPFFDAIFSIFLIFSTVGSEDDEFDGPLTNITTIIGLALMGATFAFVQHEMERFLHSYEFTYSKVYCKFERWLSEEKTNGKSHARIEEEDECESDY